MGKRLPSYRRHPNGQAFFEYQGKRTYLGKYDCPKSRQRFARAVAQIAAGGAGSVVVTSSTPTISELLLEYLDFATTYYSSKGKPSKEFWGMAATLKHLDESLGDVEGRDFGSAKLMEFQHYMTQQQYSRKKGKLVVWKRYTRTMINKMVGRVKRFIRWCSRKELIPSEQYSKLLCVEPLMKGRCQSPEPVDIVPVPRAVVEMTLPYLKPEVAAMVQVQMLCGMRPQDVCGMRGIDIAEHDPVWIYEVSEHKNAWRDQDLIKAIPRHAQALIRPYMVADREQFIFSPRRSEEVRQAIRRENRTSPMTPSQKKRAEKAKGNTRLRDRYDTDSYRRAINHGFAKAKRAGVTIPHWHPNQLRHTIATEIRQSLGEQASQVWLGHACLETTAIYAQKQISELIAVAQELDRLWSSESALEQSPLRRSS